MKMKVYDLGGKVITIKSDQMEAKRCYENNLKTKRGVFMVTTRAPREERIAPAEYTPFSVLEFKIINYYFKMGDFISFCNFF